MPQTGFRLHHHLETQSVERPGAVGWVFERQGAVTFAEMAEAAASRAAWLASQGLQPGHRLMIIAENGFEIIALALAGWQRDAWVMPVNARLSTREIAALIDHADPALVVFCVESDAAADHAERWSAVAHEGHQFRFLHRPGTDTEPVSDDPREQIAALMYTTGTTGSPKGVMLSHANLDWYARESAAFRGLKPDDRTFCPLPLTHIFGFASAFLANLKAGARLDPVARFDAARTLDALAEGVTVFPGVPAMYAQILDEAERRGIDQLNAPKLRHILTGGAPLDVDWKRRVEALFRLPIHNGYGMTECAPGISTSRDLDLATSAEDVTCGLPMPGLEVRLVPQGDDDDLVDGVGEIVVRGPNIMRGYYRNPDETKRVIDEDGFFHTGDLGRFDERGRLSVVGRCKELIIRSGFNVYPPEVEQALSRHPSVTLAAVVGRPVKGNEEVIAFVQKVPGHDVDEQELKSFLENDLAPYKRPSRIIVEDALPASSTGKILKSSLLSYFADRLV